MTRKLEGQRIVLTGCSRGVGLASSRLFLKEGARVLGISKDSARLASVSPELTSLGDFRALPLDLAATDAPGAAYAAAEAFLGGVDILVNNAGIMLSHDEEITAEQPLVLERTLELNLLAPFRLSRALLPLILKGKEPRILHVSSGAGTHGGMQESGIASYRLSKWALNGLTLLQARELRGKVCVNAFDPGWVRTDLGGPRAPGVPEDSASGMLKTLTIPWDKSGGFYKDGEEIPW